MTQPSPVGPSVIAARASAVEVPSVGTAPSAGGVATGAPAPATGGAAGAAAPGTAGATGAAPAAASAPATAAGAFAAVPSVSRKTPRLASSMRSLTPVYH